MEQSPPWEVDSHSAGQETVSLLHNLKVQYCVHKSIPLWSIPQFIPTQSNTSQFNYLNKIKLYNSLRSFHFPLFGWGSVLGSTETHLHLYVQTDSGAHPVSYKMGTEVSSSGNKTTSWPLIITPYCHGAQIEGQFLYLHLTYIHTLFLASVLDFWDFL
jgi:hypothetical protein